MGGSACLARCTVDDALLEERALPRTLLDRLLFRTRVARPRAVTFGDVTHTELVVPEALDALPSLFRAWLAPRSGRDAAARVVVDEYLAVDVTSVSVHSEARAGAPPECDLQITFSGCAGLAEVSSAVAAHWCERFVDDEERALATLAARGGVHVLGVHRFDGVRPPVFFPLRAGGYVSIVDAVADVPGVPAPEDLPWLEVDEALRETRSDVDDALSALRPLVVEATRDGRCRCALCDPGFTRTDALAL